MKNKEELPPLKIKAVVGKCMGNSNTRNTFAHKHISNLNKKSSAKEKEEK